MLLIRRLRDVVRRVGRLRGVVRRVGRLRGVVRRVDRLRAVVIRLVDFRLFIRLVRAVGRRSALGLDRAVRFVVRLYFEVGAISPRITASLTPRGFFFSSNISSVCNILNK